MHYTCGQYRGEWMPSRMERTWTFFSLFQHFSDITSLHTLNPPTEPDPQHRIVQRQKKMNSDTGTCSPTPKAMFSGVQGHSPFTEYSECFNEVQNSRCCPSYFRKESCISLKPNGKHSIKVPSESFQRKIRPFEEIHHSQESKRKYFPFLKNVEVTRGVNSSQHGFGGPTHNNFDVVVAALKYNQGGVNAYLGKSPPKGICPSEIKMGGNLDVPVLLQNPADQAIESVLGVRKQPLTKQHKSSPLSQPSWYLTANREVFQSQQSSGSFLGEFGGTAISSPGCQFEERFQDDYPSAPTANSSQYDPEFCKSTLNSGRLFNVDFQIAEEYTGRKRFSLLSSSNRRQQDASAGIDKLQHSHSSRRLIEMCVTLLSTLWELSWAKESCKQCMCCSLGLRSEQQPDFNWLFNNVKSSTGCCQCGIPVVFHLSLVALVPILAQFLKICALSLWKRELDFLKNPHPSKQC